MPIIIDPVNFDTWLDPDTHDAGILKPQLKPWHEVGIKYYPVSRRVNSPKNDGIALIQQISI